MLTLNSHTEQTDPSIVPDLYLTPDISTSCNVVDITQLGAALPAYQTVYSGYMTVSSSSKSALAYIFYGSQKAKTKDELANYPTIIWLNGGPGTSSHMGNFMELGPIFILEDGTKVVNKHSWNTEYNLMFIDNPIGVGYSYAESKSDIPTTQDQVADQFVYALNEFINSDTGCLKSQGIQKLQESPWFLSGESFAGKYIPAIGERILQQTTLKINFRGMTLGNPNTDLVSLVNAIPSYAYQMHLLDYDQLRQCEYLAYVTVAQMKDGDYNSSILSYYQLFTLIQSFTGNINSFNIFIFGTYKYREPSIQNYLESNETKQIFGFSDQVQYVFKNLEVKNGFGKDLLSSRCVSKIENILKHGKHVLIYNGQNDLSVPSPGTAKWVNDLKHTCSNEFKEMKYGLWVLNDKVVGYKKQAGNLELRQVNSAGHLVPMDAPEAALDLIVSFIESHK